MQHLLNLLAAISLLVWGTHIVRTGILRVYGEALRKVLADSVRHRAVALLSGLGVTGLVQSATATCLITSSFVGKSLIGVAPALAIMLGADIGSALMAVVFSFDLSWLSPLLIFVGVVLFIRNQSSTVGRLGRVAIGLGLITLALQLIMAATQPLVKSPVVQSLLAALPNEVLVEILVGAVLAVACYSSLAVVLLTAALAGTGLVPLPVALGLVLGANVGSGLLAVLATGSSDALTRRVPVGHALFKALGALLLVPLMPAALPYILQTTQHLSNFIGMGTVGGAAKTVVLFHLLFNTSLALAFIAFTQPMAALVARLLPIADAANLRGRPQYLDPTALATPSLAISCAAREALHQADVVETMLRGIWPVIKDNDADMAGKLREKDDVVDELYSAIKYYLTKISREALSEREGRRWADIMSFTINMEQIGDIIERVLQDIEDKKIRPNRSFSEAGMAEICHLQERLLANLRLSMSVFLDGHTRDAQRLLEEKALFRDLEREYARNHLTRLQDHTVQSIETSSLHIDLISDLKRINSHICSIAYPILESAGALSATRLKQGSLIEGL